jgi:hypothetical protein
MKCKAVLIYVFLLTVARPCVSQELFPLNEPASSVPKNVLGIRVLNQNYKEVNLTRSMYAIRAMYGVTSKLSLLITGSISNHHDRKLPTDLINHTHTGNQTNYYTQSPKRGVNYPYFVQWRQRICQVSIRVD